MAAKSTSPPRLWEVTTRNDLGRETVHRLHATDADAAVNATVERGIDREHVVDVREAGA